MKIEYQIYFWLSLIHLNILFIRFIWCFLVLNKSIHFEQLPVIFFFFTLLLESWVNEFGLFKNQRLLIYHSLLPSIFLTSHFVNYSKYFYSLAVLFVSFVLYLLKNDHLLFIVFNFSILFLMYNAFRFVKKSSKDQFQVILNILLALFLFFALFQNLLKQFDFDWSSSRYLIYFSTADLVVFVITLTFLHVYFRRLFFN